jgi:hypothetical protein
MNRRQGRRFIVLGLARRGGRGASPSGTARRSVSAAERRVGVLDVEAGVDADLDRGGIEHRKADQDGKDEKQELHRIRGLVPAAPWPRIDIVN